MQDEMIAINDGSFDETIMNFYKFKEDLNATFSSINSLVDILGNNFESDTSKRLLSNYRTFADANYSVVLDNVETFIKDLKDARANYNSFDTKLSMQINEN